MCLIDGNKKVRNEGRRADVPVHRKAECARQVARRMQCHAMDPLMRRMSVAVPVREKRVDLPLANHAQNLADVLVTFSDIERILLVGYEEDTFDVTESDENVCKILRVIRERQIDTLLTHWHGDTHPPHQRIHRMALHAARNLPRALGFSVNWYIGAAPFVPNLFVPVDETHWSRKLQALRCYESECERAGERWSAYLDRQSLNYGVQMGVIGDRGRRSIA